MKALTPLSADIGNPLFRREPQLFGLHRAIDLLFRHQGKLRGCLKGNKQARTKKLSQRHTARLAIRHGRA